MNCSNITRKTFLQGAGIVAGTALVGGLMGCTPSAKTGAADGLSMAPGTYGAVVHGHNGDYDIAVEVGETSIEDIVLGENDETHFVGTHSIEQVRTAMLDNQTPNVDAITGATYSTGAFIAGVKEALKTAGGDERDFPDFEEELASRSDETAQIVVVGSGSAGVAATLEAFQRGYDVILVEQLGVIGGSSARAGYYIGGSTALTEAHDGYSQDDFTQMLLAANPDQPELAAIYGEQAGKAIDWLYDLGLTQMYYDDACIYGQGAHWGDFGHIGGFWAEAMQKQLDENPIDVRMNTEVVELLEEGGAVVGVKVREGDEEYSIFADAVILASGGFSRNKEMVEKYTPELAGLTSDSGTGCTGTGMLMAEAVGAALDNMSDVFSYYGENVMFNGVPRNLTFPCLASGPIVVNEEGERFINELAYYARETVDAINAQTGRHGFMLMNEAQAEAIIRPCYDYSAYLPAMYTKCDTVADAARAFGIDEAALQATMARYDAMVEAGVDEDFGKDAMAMGQKIGEGPLYVAEIQSCVHMTYGGIRTDVQLHALTEADAPIPGLYAAGECRHVMLNGIGTNTIALVDGRRAVGQIEEDGLLKA